jgi:hypothetical protein
MHYECWSASSYTLQLGSDEHLRSTQAFSSLPLGPTETTCTAAWKAAANQVTQHTHTRISYTVAQYIHITTGNVARHRALESRAHTKQYSKQFAGWTLVGVTIPVPISVEDGHIPHLECQSRITSKFSSVQLYLTFSKPDEANITPAQIPAVPGGRGHSWSRLEATI